MNNVKKIRIKHNLSVVEFAKKLGVTRQDIYFIENGGHLNKKLAIRISHLLGENPIEVLGNDVFSIVPVTPEDRKIIRRLLNNHD